MPAVKLTPAQRQVLALAADGKVYRSLYADRWSAEGRRNVTVTARVLLRGGLIELGEVVGDGSLRSRVAVPTPAGRELLGETPPVGLPHYVDTEYCGGMMPIRLSFQVRVF